MVVALSGGVGGAKLALGLSRVLPPDELLIVANTGDDFEHLGLSISPDIDTLTYVLAGLDNPVTGWGRRDETWSFMETHRRAGRRDLVSARRPRSRPACRAHAAAQGRRDAVADHRRRLPPSRHCQPRAADERRSACARACARTTAGSTSRTISCASSAVRSCASWSSTAPTRRAPQPDIIATLRERQGARRGDLPVQSLHQHRADPGRAGDARRPRRLRRAGGRGLAHRRRPRGQGTDREDDAGARPGGERRVGRRRGTAICSRATSSTRPMRRASAPRCTSPPP